MTKFWILATSICLSTLLFAPSTFAIVSPEQGRLWVEKMKGASRGPYSHIRWFCKDGTVLAPQPYACSDHGGGVQHGEWSRQARELRKSGYFIASFLADVEVDRGQELAASPTKADRFKQLLIERYLTNVDDGWVFRKARYYRGSKQVEDEVRGARKLLLRIAQSREWLTFGFPVLRIGVRALPHGIDTPSVVKVRQLAIDLSNRDRKFLPLRNKIHISPDATDAQAVREFANKLGQEKAVDYLDLADRIDKIYETPPLNLSINRLSRRVSRKPNISRSLRDMSARLISTRDPAILFDATARTLAVLREHILDVKKSGIRLDVLDTSVVLEAENFNLSREILKKLDTATRVQRLSWLRSSLEASYGTGMLTKRQLLAMNDALDRLSMASVSLATYRDELNYLARVPGWAAQNLRMHFNDPLKKLSEIEPLTELFIQDQLRGSPLLFYVEVLDSLQRDANKLAGLSNRLFGLDVGTGLRSLNPGLARGVLYLVGINDTIDLEKDDFDSKGIYLLPQTVADLPPVAGILTTGEGNPLSHVQLLARNLGIPNVSIDDALIDKLKPYENKKVFMAVSPSGAVSLFEYDKKYDYLFDNSKGTDNFIDPDLKKLDLTNSTLTPLSELRVSDSGRIVGPKAAKLGELHHYFPGSVANGLTIPFSVFRELLRQPVTDSNMSVFDWMVEQYQQLGKLPEDSPLYRKKLKEFRNKLNDWILQADPGEDFRQRLAEAMEKVFGKDGTYGVFVRSDTNVEDLPQFTGAGLNLTVPNVVGFENILKAISRVWASPFSERAFAWRQAHMSQPQHVYPAILLMRSVPVNKSGVMVTQDIDTGDPGWLSIAVNEGVGGAVDGQAAEAIKVNTETGEIRLIAQATANVRRLLKKRGGISKVPVSGSDTILTAEDIDLLIRLSKTIHKDYPGLVVGKGETARQLPADIEFGFLDGKLQLFQIRPFVDSSSARESSFLLSMSKSVVDMGDVKVKLNEIPE